MSYAKVYTCNIIYSLFSRERAGETGKFLESVYAVTCLTTEFIGLKSPCEIFFIHALKPI